MWFCKRKVLHKSTLSLCLLMRQTRNTPKDEFKTRCSLHCGGFGWSGGWQQLERFGKWLSSITYLTIIRLYLILFEDGSRMEFDPLPQRASESGWIVSRFHRCWMTLRLFESCSPDTWALLDSSSQCNWLWQILQWILVGVSLCGQRHLSKSPDLCDGSSVWNLPARIAQAFNLAVASDKGTVDVGKNCASLCCLPRKRKFSKLLAFLIRKTSSLGYHGLFPQEAQAFSLKTGFHYDKSNRQREDDWVCWGEARANETFTK